MITSLLIQSAISLSTTQKEIRACAYTCDTVCYTDSSVNAAQQAGYNLYASSQMADSYPHEYHDYEGFNFPVPGTYYEFPILSDGEIYDGGSPGADRVIFNELGQLAGVITHTGASGEDFVLC